MPEICQWITGTVNNWFIQKQGNEVELLRTLECLFMGELLHPQLLNTAESPEEWGLVWFVWLIFVCFCLWFLYLLVPKAFCAICRAYLGTSSPSLKLQWHLQFLFNLGRLGMYRKLCMCDTLTSKWHQVTWSSWQDETAFFLLAVSFQYVLMQVIQLCQWDFPSLLML